MKRLRRLLSGCFVVGQLAAAEPVFVQDFSKVEPGALPDEFLVYDGQFIVKEEAGNRFAELPGAPLESYALLFGPNESQGVEVAARIFGTKTGRKFPTLGVGLNGASGYRLQVSPAKGILELFRGDVAVTNAPFVWKSGEWTELRLVVRRVNDGNYRVEGTAWATGTTAPAEPLVRFDEAKLQPPGKASVWGMPFSGTPIRFDDLKVTRLDGA